ncbi:unnamed protein product [Strongylus vulgaris]|uniref:Uncharacterized protein n=1 Tax=Strongylus vulgaris TaxID=40348 RepID=A0A3P7IUE2_STRVU|nr:unnamed protein product [Strongylus vulgaris]
MWYSGCPKYEQYHYASQFIYSKAEKGKRVELPQNSKPFNVVSPSGERIPVVVKQQQGGGAVARDDPLRDTVEWESPVILNPNEFEQIAEKNSSNATTVWQSIDPLAGNDKEQANASPKKNETLKDEPIEGLSSGKREKDTPVVPSDSVFSNALSQYGAFTDTRGILHRPRSRSPFTKPG